MAKALDVGTICAFDTRETNLGVRWKKWKKQFEYYIVASGITQAAQKRALLLHVAGPRLQDIFETLSETGNSYEQAIEKLDEYLLPKMNVTHARRMFAECDHKEGESMASYVTRLREMAANCEYGDLTEDLITSHAVDKCKNKRLQRRLYQEENLKLEKLLTLSRSSESADEYTMSSRPSEPQINAVVHNPTRGHGRGRYTSNSHGRGRGASHGRDHQNTPSCYRCGYTGHNARDCRVAMGKTCNKCGKLNHFASVCKSTKQSDNNPTRHSLQPQRQNNTKYSVNYTGVGDVLPSDDEYVFQVRNTDSETSEVKVRFNNNTVSVLLDSGSTSNIISMDTYEKLNSSGVLKLENTNKRLYPYGSDVPLPVVGIFRCTISTNTASVEGEVFVIQGSHRSLLSKRTCMDLHLIDMVSNVSDAKPMDNELNDILSKYEQCFNGLGKLKNYQLKIHLDESVPPVVQNVRRVPFNIRKQVEEKLDELLKLDVIEPVNGPTPWVSPLVIVPKPHKGIRICLDMRRANEAVKREHHPIPTVDEILQEMGDACVITKLDLTMGYHQIELDESSRNITTFVTHRGLYRYKRLVFGISCASEIYQHLVQQVLHGCEGVRNISDDIIVYGKDSAEHNKRLEKVLQRLCDQGLTLNRSKCRFALNELVFMGHILSDQGIKADKAKVEAVENAPTPRTVAEVKSFLGLVSYCSRFIPDFATVAEPLRILTRRNTEWTWGDAQQAAFNELKHRLTSSHVMAYYNSEADTQLIVDASPVGLGGVLVQKQGDGEYSPIAFASRALSEVERRYSQTEKEALAVVWGCERFHMYLYGRKFELLTDHKPLEYIYSKTSRPSARIERWVLRLQPYDYAIKYIPGASNIADSLSRLLSQSAIKSSRNVGEEYVHFVTHNAVPKAMTLQEIEIASRQDKTLQNIQKCINSNNWSTCCKEYRLIQHEVTNYGDILLKNNRIVIPESLQSRVLQLAHEGHSGIVRTKQRLRDKVWWPGMDKQIENMVISCHACQVVSGNTFPTEPMQPTKMPAGPWQELAIDLCGPLPSGETICVMVDYYSRWVEAVVLKSTTSDVIVRWMRNIFSIHGIPMSIKSDNGPQFISETYVAFLQEYGIKAKHVTPYWPQANGGVERMNRAFMKALRAANVENENWRNGLTSFLMNYRSTPHFSTGVTPAELMFGRKIRTKLPQISLAAEDNIHEKAKLRDEHIKEKAKTYTDYKRKASVCELKEGDRVLLKYSIRNKADKLSPRFEKDPYRVVSKYGNCIVLRSQDGRVVKRNVSHVKRYISSGDNVPEIDDIEIPKNNVANDAIPIAQSNQPVLRPRRTLQKSIRYNDEQFIYYK